MTREQYKPALNFGWLTSLYDPLMRWTMPEAGFKQRLIEQSKIENGHQVLDVGCGTGTMTIDIKRLHPGADVYGLDGDAKVLDIARQKATADGASVSFVEGMSYDLEYEDDFFDRALSSLLFHHLSRENKDRTLREVFRVLKPAGELHVADWGKASNVLMRAAFLGVQMLDGFDTTTDHVKGHLPGMVRAAGFTDVEVTGEFGTIFGTLALLRARKP